MKKNKDLSSRLYTKVSVFGFIFFIIVFLMVFLMLGLLILSPLGHLIVISGLGGTTLLALVFIYIASSLVTSTLVNVFAKLIFGPLVDVSKKTNRVAKGDFNVSVDERSSIPELRDLLHNFNIMVKELKKVDTISNEFISNVSHEFKTPLAVIRSSVNILENSDITEEEKRMLLKKINDSTEQLSSLVSNVLRISKLENQNIKPISVSFRLDEQIRQQILLLEDRFEKKNINLELDLDDCMINSDQEMLAHVWSNLISNAIKFSPDNSTIFISLKVEDDVIFKIKDEGIGMDQNTITHIFDRFYQGETSHSKEGNGLGLTIVKKIIDNCDGRIEVISEIDKGSTFIVTFPKKFIINN